MRTVLVVDDSATVREQVAAALLPGGFHMVEAADGEAGLALIRSTPHLALVICDVNMPRMGGLDMLEKIQEEPTLEVPPIVMLTSEGRADMVTRARQAGAKGWLIKPFKPEQLLAVARKLAKSA